MIKINLLPEDGYEPQELEKCCGEVNYEAEGGYDLVMPEDAGVLERSFYNLMDHPDLSGAARNAVCYGAMISGTTIAGLMLGGGAADYTNLLTIVTLQIAIATGLSAIQTFKIVTESICESLEDRVAE